MKVSSKPLLFLVFFLTAALPVRAGDALQAAWLKLIKTELPPGCEVSIMKIGARLIGNNGMREEQWRLNTCLGKREYWVYFYPPSAFPDRHSPYAVVRVTSNPQ